MLLRVIRGRTDRSADDECRFVAERERYEGRTGVLRFLSRAGDVDIRSALLLHFGRAETALVGTSSFGTRRVSRVYPLVS